MTLLHIPFALNILILIPMVWSLWFSTRANVVVFQGVTAVEPTPGRLIGALWFGVLATSVAALANPEAWRMVLVFQVVYKASFLLVDTLPKLIGGRTREIPLGVTLTFAGIVATWPIFLALS